MANALIKIVLGILLCSYIPKWIKYGDKKIRGYIQLGCNIIGIILVIFGALSILNSFM